MIKHCDLRGAWLDGPLETRERTAEEAARTLE